MRAHVLLLPRLMFCFLALFLSSLVRSNFCCLHVSEENISRCSFLVCHFAGFKNRGQLILLSLAPLCGRACQLLPSGTVVVNYFRKWGSCALQSMLSSFVSLGGVYIRRILCSSLSHRFFSSFFRLLWVGVYIQKKRGMEGAFQTTTCFAYPNPQTINISQRYSCVLIR